MARDLKEIRNEIDKLDTEMLDAFIRRMDLARQVAEYKVENSLPIENKDREREILAEVLEKSGDMGVYSHRFFSSMMNISKAYQSTIVPPKTDLVERIQKSILPVDTCFPRTGTVACQGIEGAHSQEAADKMFECGNIVYLKTFEAIFDAVESGLCKYGILPIENSSHGSVRTVYELLQKKNVSIIRSEKICIRHALLAKPGTKLSDIKEIYSHEQALGQCSRFLKGLGDDVKLIPVANTAMAAKAVAESDSSSVASLSSRECAELYGLDVVDTNVMNSDNNYTRFICITKDPQIYPGANKISLILTTAHKPGALYEILSKFSALGINLLKLESAPIIGEDFEFVFYFDIEASVNEPGVLTMISELERTCGTFKFLGNYSEN